MDINSLVFAEDETEISFQDKISVAFVIMGAIFLGLLVIALIYNLFQFEQMEFTMPFS